MEGGRTENESGVERKGRGGAPEPHGNSEKSERRQYGSGQAGFSPSFVSGNWEKEVGGGALGTGPLGHTTVLGRAQEVQAPGRLRLAPFYTSLYRPTNEKKEKKTVIYLTTKPRDESKSVRKWINPRDSQRVQSVRRFASP